jgi:hypothetical protein
MAEDETPLLSPILEYLAKYMDKVDAKPTFLNNLALFWIFGLLFPIGALHEMYLRGEFKK